MNIFLFVVNLDAVTDRRQPRPRNEDINTQRQADNCLILALEDLQNVRQRPFAVSGDLYRHHAV
jgi:hypothetical protein